MTREDCRNIITPLLPPQRIFHSECVADAAAALARQYGADAHKAMLAGMLHDCMKYASDEQSAAFEDLPKPIQHAFVGAAYLANECGVADEEILGAVRWHTTGRAGMTLLEEVVFVADLISADRRYPDVEEVRRLAAINLHDASRYILEYIFQKIDHIYPASLAWYHELTEETHAAN